MNYLSEMKSLMIILYARLFFSERTISKRQEPRGECCGKVLCSVIKVTVILKIS
jgi:hypothetical protein